MGFKKKLVIRVFLLLLGVGSLSFFAFSRDPFMPLIDSYGRVLIAREIDVEGMSLEGIIYSEENPAAVINGEIIRENETIGDYLVLKIEETRVILSKEGKSYTLNMEVE